MSAKEFNEFLKNNKKQVDNATKEFEQHSKNFDKRMKKIFSSI